MKRQPGTKRKDGCFLCTIHTTRGVNPKQPDAFRLTGVLSETGREPADQHGLGKNWTQPEPFARRADPWRGEAAVGVDFSDQDEEGQRDQCGHHASGDQGVVGRDIALRVQHRLVCFSGHSGPLRQPGTDLCEVDHMRRTFFAAGSRERPGGFRVVFAQARYGGDGSRVSNCAIKAWPGRWHGPPLAGGACRCHGAGGASRSPHCSLRCQLDFGRRGASGASGADLWPLRIGL